MARAKITSTAVSNRTTHAALQAPAIHDMKLGPTDMRVCSRANGDRDEGLQGTASGLAHN